LRNTLAGEITEKNERVHVEQLIQQSLFIAHAYEAIPFEDPCQALHSTEFIRRRTLRDLTNNLCVIQSQVFFVYARLDIGLEYLPYFVVAPAGRGCPSPSRHPGLPVSPASKRALLCCWSVSAARPSSTASVFKTGVSLDGIGRRLGVGPIVSLCAHGNARFWLQTPISQRPGGPKAISYQ
jgi:hypothetical protein